MSGLVERAIIEYNLKTEEEKTKYKTTLLLRKQVLENNPQTQKVINRLNEINEFLQQVV